MSRDIDKLMREREELLAALNRVDESMLQARRKNADEVYAWMVESVKNLGEHFSPSQKRALIALLGGRGEVKRGGAVIPKYRLPDGTTWAGRGKPPKTFESWAKTKEGRAWRNAHPGQKWPAYPDKNAGRLVSSVTKPAAPTGKRASKKVAKKAAKKATAKKATARKKSTGKKARKAAKA